MTQQNKTDANDKIRSKERYNRAKEIWENVVHDIEKKEVIGKI